jgi:predicted Zn-dependent protease
MERIRVGLGLGAVAAMALSVGCARSPATGTPQLVLIPERQEVEIGRQASEEVQQTVGLYEAPQLQNYVEQVGRRLVGHSERQQLPWTFGIVDDSSVNAFALPGGFIYVTRGLLAHLDNEAQLAAVLGHEIGHVTARHSVERISKAQIAQLGLAVGMILSEEARRFGQLGMVGLNLLFLRFSRQDEHEADHLGLRYAYRAGYDVSQMPEVFVVLDRVSRANGGRGRLPEWLATHPAAENRIERTRAEIARLEPAPGKRGAQPADYLRRLDGLVYGQDPRHGFFREDRFFHPDLRFTVAFPRGWRTNNLRTTVLAISPAGDAAVQLTLARQESPEAGLQAFLAQRNVQATGRGGAPVPEYPSASAPFEAQTEQGRLAGFVTFVRYQNRTYQILSYAAAPRFGAFAETFRRVPRSFADLDDPQMLGVQPARLQVFSAPRRTTLTELHRERPSAVTVEELALINQTRPDAEIAPGQIVKWVGGPVLPDIQAAR